MKNKKHILFLTPGFPENENDTTCIPALQLFVKYLQKKVGLEISVLTFQYPFHSKVYFWNGIKVYALGGNNRKGLFRFWNWYKVFKLYKEILVEGPIDQIHSFWLTECAYVGSKLAKKYDVTHTCTLMGQDALGENKYVSRIKNLPDVVALSKAQDADLYDNHKLRAKYIIPWGVAEQTFIKDDEREIDILGVGSLIQLKAFDRFVEIILKLKKDFPDIKAEIVGEGTELENLHALCDKSGLSENLVFCGKLDREKVLIKMKQSKILLHLSQYESFGMVLIEASSQGAKVFSSDVGIASEVEEIDLVGDNQDAADKIADFLQNPEPLSTKTDFTIQKTVSLYLERVFLEQH